MWGAGGERALLGRGVGGGVIALSSLSPGGRVGRVSGLGLAQGETQLHKHTGHSMGGGRQERVGAILQFGSGASLPARSVF